MKKIAVQKIRKELDAIGADNATRELIINQLSLYNDLVDKYLSGTIGRDIYLMFQTNASLVKQIGDLKKATKNLVDNEDGFTNLIDSMKKAAK
jgi:hypothetical protein